MVALSIRSRATLWRLRSTADFPRPIDRNGRLLWLESELLAWVNAQPRRATVDANHASLLTQPPWREEPTVVEPAHDHHPRLGRPRKAESELAPRSKRRRAAEARAADPATVPD